MIDTLTMQTIAVLMTCHNRRANTLACLDALFANLLPVGYELKVFLVDDGSSDGTDEAVSERYPDVTVIHGDGNLFWAGGMRMAWSVAAAQRFHFYLWLNDDTNLYVNAIEKLIESTQKTGQSSIICATVCSKVSGDITYGGKMRRQIPYLIPNNGLQECEIISGNCVLIPDSVYLAIGTIDEIFIHAIGDWDYGLRAVKAGFKCYVAPALLGSCEANPSLPKWCLTEVSFRQRLLSLYSPLASAQPLPYFIFVSRHYGYVSALRQLILMHIRVAMPWLWSMRHA